jgi:serine/threonine protein kinase/tetratricopeptide (TPR) repeat protein
VADDKDSRNPGDLNPTIPLTAEEVEELKAQALAAAGSTDPLVGTLLRDKWRVLERIGAGSFGTVYKVRDETGGWIEALKILSVDRLRGAEAENMRKRFLREAQIMKRLGTRSPYIVGLATYEEDLEAGLVYFLMEHVDGRNLADVLDEDGPMDVDRVVRIGLQVCDALTVAHESPEPVIHRDLKLQNLMLESGGEDEELIKVLDFGIAKILQSDADSRLTSAGALGTPGYAAPEQLRAEDVDARTDLFSLGVILYALLTGRDPWLGHLAYQPTDQLYRLMAATDRGEVRPIEEAGRPVPPAMASIVMRLLRREPKDRFQSARELKEAFLSIAPSQQPRARRITTGSGLRLPSQGGDQGTGPERRLAAVWFADLVGYSSLSSTDEGAALALLDTFHTTALSVIEDGGGRLVQFIGDAAFAEFTSTERAVRTAMDFHARFSEATEGVEPRPALRTGVHVGDVLMSANGDLFGDGVNVASRIQNEAEPGQIVVSQDVWRQLKQRRDFSFVSIGERELKNMAAPVWLFAVSDEAHSEEAGAEIALATSEARGSQLSHVAQVAFAYLAASGATLYGSTMLAERLALGLWVMPVATLLLTIGLVVVSLTAWLQSRPTWERRVSEMGPWTLDVADLFQSLTRRQIPQLNWARAMAGGVLAFSLLFAAAGALSVLQENQSGAPSSSARAGLATVALVPFDATGENRLLGEGLTDLLALALDGPQVHVVHPLVVSRYVDAFGASAQSLIELMGAELGATVVVTGSVSTSGGFLSVDMTAYDPTSGRRLGEVNSTGEVSDLHDLVAGLVDELAEVGSLANDTSRDALEAVLSPSGAAIQAYLEGERRRREGDLSGAIAAYEGARAADPTFVLASSRLALAQILAAAPGQSPLDPPALNGDQGLVGRERLVLRGLSQLRDRSPNAIVTLDSLTTGYPSDPDGWFLLGYASRELGEGAESESRSAFTQAVQLAGTYEAARLYLQADAGRDVADSGDGRLAVDAGARSGTFERAEAGNAGLATGVDSDIGSGSSDEEERAEYRTLLSSVQSSRSAFQGNYPEALSGRVAELEGLWERAQEAAAQGMFANASAALRLAESGFSDLRIDNRRLAQYEREQVALDSMRALESDPSIRARAEELERDGERAMKAGRYDDALTALRAAAAAWSDAIASGRQAADNGAPATPDDPPGARAEPASTPQPSEIAVQVLDRMKAAIEAEDIARVRSVWTSMSSDEERGLVALFDSVRDLVVTYTVTAVEERGGRVVVSVSTAYSFFAERARDVVVTETTQVLEIDRSGTDWVVVLSN